MNGESEHEGKDRNIEQAHGEVQKSEIIRAPKRQIATEIYRQTRPEALI